MNISSLEDFRNMSSYEQANWLADVLSEELGLNVIFTEEGEVDGKTAFEFIINDNDEEMPMLDQYERHLKSVGFNAELYEDEGESFIILFPYDGLPEYLFESKINKKSKMLNEKQWVAKVNIAPAMTAWEENEDLDEFKTTLINILESNYDYLDLELGGDAVHELDVEIVDELKMVDDVEEVDYILSDLYNWADDYNVWLEQHDL
ncbi:MAG: hypothetical protein ACOC1K_04010 [Nanoarchaeota archaeon]